MDYSNYDPSDINSIMCATRAFQLEFDNKRGTRAASESYMKLKEFYGRAISGVDSPDISKYMEEPPKNQLRVNIYSGSKYISWVQSELEKKYRPYGIGIVYDEGDFYLTHSNTFLYEEFAPYLSKDWQELLKFETYFDTHQIEYDAHIIISKEEFREIYNFYKQFYKKYPDFTDRKRIKNTCCAYERLLKKNWDKDPNPVW